MLAVWGQKRVAVGGAWDGSAVLAAGRRQLLPVLDDWVLAAQLLRLPEERGGDATGSGVGDGGSPSSVGVAIGFSHNFVEVWKVEWAGDGGGENPHPTRLRCVRGADNCILYGLSFFGRDMDVLQVGAGTVFNTVLVWNLAGAEDGRPALRLDGHGGVIFRLAWASDGQSLLSTSDDRTLRLWSAHPLASRVAAEGPDGGCALEFGTACVLGTPVTKTGEMKQIWAAFGHRARVWDAAFSTRFIVSGSEDSTVGVWSYAGESLGFFKVSQLVLAQRETCTLTHNVLFRRAMMASMCGVCQRCSVGTQLQCRAVVMVAFECGTSLPHPE